MKIFFILAGQIVIDPLQQLWSAAGCCVVSIVAGLGKTQGSQFFTPLSLPGACPSIYFTPAAAAFPLSSTFTWCSREPRRGKKKKNRLRDALRLRGEALSVHKSHYWKFLKYCLMHKTLHFFFALLFYWKVNTLQRRYIMHQIEVLSTC